MKKISLFIIILMLSSCSASYHVKKAEQKCPECFKQDTTIEEIVFMLDTVIRVDTNILVLLPRDTVKIEKLIPKYVNIAPIKKKNGIITVEVSAYKGSLIIESYLDSAMLYRYEDSIRIKNAQIVKLRREVITRSIVIQEKETKLKKAFKTLKYWIIGLGSIIVILFTLRFIKRG